jgi:hypothetical protein
VSFEIENGVLKKYTEEDGVTEVVIPEGVTSIGDSAFYFCSSLTSITIPDGVTSIGESAFWGCSSLTSVNIPDSVTSIENIAFSHCTSLTSIKIPDSVTSIEKSAFNGCTSLTSIKIPDGMTSIGVWAFNGCSSLTSIKIPDGVTSIGAWAFKDCTSLKSIKIPNSVTSIGNGAFNGCSSLKSAKMPDSLTIIGKGSFDYCENLRTFVFNNGSLKIKAKDVKEIEADEKSLGDAIDMLFTKDFARKFSHKVKFKLIIDYFFASADDDAKAYIKKNFTKIMKQTIENGDIERTNQLLEKTDFVTKRNIDKFIEYAIEKEQHEIYLILLNYKNEKIGFKSVEEQFKL